jgi:hypothetical protein
MSVGTRRLAREMRALLSLPESASNQTGMRMIGSHVSCYLMWRSRTAPPSSRSDRCCRRRARCGRSIQLLLPFNFRLIDHATLYLPPQQQDRTLSVPFANHLKPQRRRAVPRRTTWRRSRLYTNTHTSSLAKIRSRLPKAPRSTTQSSCQLSRKQQTRRS